MTALTRDPLTPGQTVLLAAGGCLVLALVAGGWLIGRRPRARRPPTGAKREVTLDGVQGPYRRALAL